MDSYILSIKFLLLLIDNESVFGFIAFDENVWVINIINEKQ